MCVNIAGFGGLGLHAALDEVACDVDNSYASPSVAEVKTMMYPYKKYAK